MIGIDFTGQTVIVTGAGAGLGRAYALDLAARGATVIVNDLGTSTRGDGVSPEAAEAVVAEIRASGGDAVSSTDSVADPDGCKRIAALACASRGRIDAVIHNAGILRNAAFEGMTPDRFFPLLDVHLGGAYLLSRSVWPTMIEQGYGRLVFTSSSSAVFGRVNGANYAAAKAGVVGLCNALALEGQEHGILVNAVMPVAVTRLAGAPDEGEAPSPSSEVSSLPALDGSRLSPEWVTPLVVWLASRSCDRTHAYYSAVRGRYARVFVGVTSGWTEPTDAPPTAEALMEHLAQIEDRAVYDLPASTFEEIELVARRAKII